MLRRPTQSLPPRAIRCYHCRAETVVSGHAQSGSCPHCNRHFALLDIVITRRHWGGRLETCGKARVEQDAIVRTPLLVASEGVEVHGNFAGRLVSFGPVVVGPDATIDADVEAPAIRIEPGARILGGRFTIRPPLPPALPPPVRFFPASASARQPAL